MCCFSKVFFSILKIPTNTECSYVVLWSNQRLVHARRMIYCWATYFAWVEIKIGMVFALEEVAVDSDTVISF